MPTSARRPPHTRAAPRRAAARLRRPDERAGSGHPLPRDLDRRRGPDRAALRANAGDRPARRRLVDRSSFRPGRRFLPPRRRLRPLQAGGSRDRGVPAQPATTRRGGRRPWTGRARPERRRTCSSSVGCPTTSSPVSTAPPARSSIPSTRTSDSSPSSPGRGLSGDRVWPRRTRHGRPPRDRNRRVAGDRAVEATVFFDAQTPESLCEAVERFEHEHRFNPCDLRRWAEGFSPARFDREFDAEIALAFGEARKCPTPSSSQAFGRPA